MLLSVSQFCRTSSASFFYRGKEGEVEGGRESERGGGRERGGRNGDSWRVRERERGRGRGRGEGERVERVRESENQKGQYISTSLFS